MVENLCSTRKDLGSALKIAKAFRKTEAEVRRQITADFGYGGGGGANGRGEGHTGENALHQCTLEGQGMA